MKIYVASSWRNDYQPLIVQFLCPACGHDQVYDFAKLWDLDLTDYQDDGSWES